MLLHSLETGIGYDIVLWFQSWRTDFITTLFLPFNYFIGEISLLLLLPLIYWCISKDSGKRFVTITLISSLLNIWFKAFFARPRPYQVTVSGKPAIVPTLPALNSYGIPSGHTQSGVVIFGFFAREVRNRLFTVVMVLLMILTGISRLISGMHYPQDVGAGALLGILVLFLYPAIESTARRFLNNLALPMKIFLALLLLAILLFLFKKFIPDLKEYNSYAALAGVYSFALIGFSLETRYVRFRTRGLLIEKLLRFVIGMAVTFGLYIGLKILFHLIEPNETTTLFFILRLIRYSSLGLWVSAGAPALFIKLRLAQRE